MDIRIANMIKGSAKVANVFCDSYGNIVFGLLDTRGLYHISCLIF